MLSVKIYKYRLAHNADKDNQGSNTNELFGYETFEPENRNDESNEYKPSSLEAEANDYDQYKDQSEQLNELIESDNDDEFDIR